MSQKILLIEPGEEARRLLASALTPYGFNVSCPVDSYVALEFVTQHTFDAILLNENMPIINGQGFLRILLQQGLKIPAIVLRNATASADTTTYQDYPCLTCIDKPFQIEQLVTQIHTLIQTA